KLGNILVDPQGRIASLDSKKRSRGACYMDLAKLYADLIGDRLSLLSAGLINKPSQWKRALLDGYFQTDSFHESIFKVYSAIALLDKWIRDEHQAEAGSVRNVFARVWFRKYFFQLLIKILTAWLIVLNCGFDFSDLFQFG